MKPLTRTLTHAIAALGLAGAAISPALATPSAPMTIKVTAADLNLDNPAGQRTLDQRINEAARSVCRVTSPTTGTRIMNNDTQSCLVKARTDAREQAAVLIANQQRGG